MKILILGAAGFLGRNCYYHFSENHEVTAVDNLDPRLRSEYPDYPLRCLDIRSFEEMATVVVEQDVIINCAAQTSHPLSMSDPFFDVEINCLGNLVLLEAVRHYNPEALLIYPSSTTVVGPVETVEEGVRENPIDIYSANKLAAEKYYQIYHKVYGLRTVIPRLPNLFGAYGKGYPEFGFVNYFIYLAQHKKPIAVYGDGQQQRCILYIKDVLSLFDFLIECPHYSEPFGIGGDHLTVMEVAKNIAEVFSGEVIQVKWPVSRKKIDVGSVHVDSFFNFAWTWHYTFREGLEDMIYETAR